MSECMLVLAWLLCLARVTLRARCCPQCQWNILEGQRVTLFWKYFFTHIDLKSCAKF